MPDQTARRAHELLKQAAALDEQSRAPFVESQCNGDRQLYKTVMSLLAALTASHEFLEAPALSQLAPAQAAPRRDSAPTPDAVGNYLIVGVLGVGGMATVYEAIQEQPRRRVALKVLHHGLTHTNAYERFAFETEALARLHHPGIAQIYESGAAPLGPSGPVPFFAMELIPEAVTLTAFAQRQSLSLRARIELFASVCDAVHHGHQHGVIHRDLKPGNVLVDRDGRAKVIDFGIARATESSGEPLTAVTDVRQIVGTLNYMAPEQCTPNSAIDIRTDVYSLGVLLHELLCGTLPHDVAGAPLPAALNTIAHEPVSRPIVPFAGANRYLEAILVKALEKQPERRYDSASALASDLRRWLNNQPIEARTPGVIDQCRLFAKRNRAVVAVGSSIVLSAILIAALSTIFAVKLSNEVTARRTAEQQTITERDLALWQAYTAQIAGALSAYKTNEFLQMRSRLASASHPARGWEWGFLSRLAEQSSTMIVAHSDMILDFAVDEGWTRFATASADGSVRLWNAADGSLLHTFAGDPAFKMFTVDFTSDGRRLIAGDEQGIVRLLDASNLEEIEQIADFRAAVKMTRGLPNNRVAAAMDNGNARIWTLEPRSEIRLPNDQPGGIDGLEVSPEGTLLATFNAEGKVWVRNIDDLSIEHRFECSGSVNQVRFSPDSKILAAAGGSGTLILWNLADETILHEIPATGGVNTVRSLGFSNDGSIIAAGLVHRGIVVCSVLDGHIICELGGHTEAVSGLRFRPDDNLLVSTSWDRTIRMWRTDEFGTPGGAVLKGHETQAYSVCFSPDGSIIASGSNDGSVLLWDPDRACAIARLKDGEYQVHAVDFSADGQFLAAGCSDKTVRVWNTATGAVAARLTGPRSWIACVAFDCSGTRVAAGSHDTTARVWNWRTGVQELDLAKHHERVNSVRFSPDGALIATGSRDKTVRLWDASTGEEKFEFDEHESDVFAVLFSHDGKILYSGSRDQTVRVWEVARGRLLRTLGGHGQFVTSLALATDGTRLAAGSWFGEVVLFDVRTHDQIAAFRAHESAVRGVAFSPDGRWLATASLDSTVRLFDSSSREAADETRRKANESHEAALSAVQARVELMRQSGADSIDYGGDPWLHKAALSLLAPVQVGSENQP